LLELNDLLQPILQFDRRVPTEALKRFHVRPLELDRFAFS
jgi:hypothetical protein